MITYKKASLKDIPKMQKLVLPEIESGKILHRSDDEVATNIRSYTLTFDQDILIGFVALHIHTQHLAEIRSLIVDSSFRGKGIGKNLVSLTLKEAKKLELKEVFTLTYEQEFFKKLNFKEIPKTSLPEHKIWADCIKCKHFPICDEIALILEV